MSGRMFGWIWIDSAVDGSCVNRSLLALAIVSSLNQKTCSLPDSVSDSQGLE